MRYLPLTVNISSSEFAKSALNAAGPLEGLPQGLKDSL